MKDIVTAGNWPWRLIDSGSLRVSKWATALSGTGEEDVRFTLEVAAPVAEGCDVAVAAAGREVPFSDVVALDEIDVFVLVVEFVILNVKVDVDPAETEAGPMSSAE